MIISIYGVDGCGKGTQIEALMRYLREELKYRAFRSKAYDETEKEQLGGFMTLWGTWAKTLAFQALHCDQAEQAFKAEDREQVVVADRWDESYLVFHRGPESPLEKDPELYLKLNQIAFQDRVPDISILLDLDPVVAQRRTQHRGADYFDEQPSAYHTYMRNGFLELAQQRNAHIIDASQNWGVIAEEIRKIVTPAILANTHLKPLLEEQV